MNYLNIYQSLVTKRQNIITEGYTEKHHIVPKSLGGSNDRDNLVCLTAREHFIAHLLLVKMNPNHPGLTLACFKMSCGKAYNSKKYEWLKLKHATFVSNKLKGVPKTEEHKRKISESKKRNPYKHTEETKQIISETSKSRKYGPCPEDRKQKISDTCKGRIPWNKGLKMVEQK